MASYQFFLVLGLLAFACAHTPATMIVGDNEAGNGKIYNNNYLSNGRFKQPSFTGAFNIYTDNAAAPWFAKEIQLGAGQFYNKNWAENVVVCELDAKENSVVNQNIFFTEEKSLTLRFYWARRDIDDIETSKALVYWNCQQIARFGPTTHQAAGIFREKRTFRSIIGTNTLTFMGTGKSDAFGVQITDLSICDTV